MPLEMKFLALWCFLLGDAASTAVGEVQVCPPNMGFKTCSNACHRTCDAPGQCQRGVCTKEEGCVCDDGFFMKDSDCVPQEQCGCYDEEAQNVIENGDVYVNRGCSRRSSCTDDQLHVDESYQCSDDATCDLRDGVRRCYCNDGFEGDGVTCRPTSPRDCQDLYVAGKRTDGIYTVYPHDYLNVIQVYCDMVENEGGWTVIQRRKKVTSDFYRNWSYYKTGFGNLDGDHWLGNDLIHSLTQQKAYSLRIDLTNLFGFYYYARYSSFRISSESDNYRLSIAGYYGNGGHDSFSWHNGRQFSTPDRDNDGWSDFHCAERHRGGWWFGKRIEFEPDCSALSDLCQRFPVDGGCAKCADSHLNAQMYTHNGSIRGTNIFWDKLNGRDCGIRYTEMKILPI